MRKWEKPAAPRKKPLNATQKEIVNKVTVKPNSLYPESEGGEKKVMASRGTQATPDEENGHGTYSAAEVNKLSEEQLVHLLQALDKERKVEDADTARVLTALARVFLDQGA